jgi:hypothetical protein
MGGAASQQGSFMKEGMEGLDTAEKSRIAMKLQVLHFAVLTADH